MTTLLFAQVLRPGQRPIWYTAGLLVLTVVILLRIGWNVTHDERPPRRRPRTPERMRVPRRKP